MRDWDATKISHFVLSNKRLGRRHPLNAAIAVQLNKGVFVETAIVILALVLALVVAVK